MTHRMTRRNFIGRALAAGAGFTVLPRRVLGGPGVVGPNAELTKAVIGVGGMGRGHLGYPGSRLVAACDVDAKHLAAALEGRNGVQGYRDFRELLERRDIDIIHIATPDHWHALISIAALQAGKDVWCEKPMTHTIGEGVRVVESVAAYGRVFRINTWFRFRDSFYSFGAPVKSVKKLVDAGVLGWPLKATIGTATGFTWKGEWSGRPVLDPQTVPPELDYDLWLGPAPWKPDHPHRVHGTFRGYWDYCGGGLADMGQHYLDPVQYLLGKDDTSPVEIEADCPPQHPEAVGPWSVIRMRYADGCELVLDGAGRYPDAPFLEGPSGKLFKGMRSEPEDLAGLAAALPEPEATLPTDFSESVRTRKKFALNECNGFRSATLVNLALIAMRLRRPLRFDPAALRFPDDEAANRLAYATMRSPWHT